MIRRLIRYQREAFGIIISALRGKITEDEMVDGLLMVATKIDLLVDREID